MPTAENSTVRYSAVQNQPVCIILYCTVSAEVHTVTTADSQYNTG